MLIDVAPDEVAGIKATLQRALDLDPTKRPRAGDLAERIRASTKAVADGRRDLRRDGDRRRRRAVGERCRRDEPRVAEHRQPRRDGGGGATRQGRERGERDDNGLPVRLRRSLGGARDPPTSGRVRGGRSGSASECDWRCTPARRSSATAGTWGRPRPSSPACLIAPRPEAPSSPAPRPSWCAQRLPEGTRLTHASSTDAEQFLLLGPDDDEPDQVTQTMPPRAPAEITAVRRALIGPRDATRWPSNAPPRRTLHRPRPGARAPRSVGNVRSSTRRRPADSASRSAPPTSQGTRCATPST